MEPNLAPRVCLQLQDAALELSRASSKIIASDLSFMQKQPCSSTRKHSEKRGCQSCYHTVKKNASNPTNII
ncbi:unnamed protein product [Tuber melanosporum]|uniref:(Perigord truffle) hypothetical protein n=1 Tax=Tuber melanosporum (strain Mel28) TaxID=656061 RepID=D5GFY9_TUBMM|nr:uncharacterized protein GSTUM_00001955001 [Tuber melanosporum]CAZ83432.1 unnamed protein product [Tuber melanosporum]